MLGWSLLGEGNGSSADADVALCPGGGDTAALLVNGPDARVTPYVGRMA